MVNNVYKNLNCKIDKSVSDKLEKFIADTILSKIAMVKKTLEELQVGTIKQARFKKIVLAITKDVVKDSYISEITSYFEEDCC